MVGVPAAGEHGVQLLDIMQRRFASARLANHNRTAKRRFLHVVGKRAHGDRNGTMLLMYAMQRSRGDFELVVKSRRRWSRSSRTSASRGTRRPQMISGGCTPVSMR